MGLDRDSLNPPLEREKMNLPTRRLGQNAEVVWSVHFTVSGRVIAIIALLLLLVGVAVIFGFEAPTP